MNRDTLPTTDSKGREVVVTPVQLSHSEGMSLEGIKARTQNLNEFYKSLMQEGTDYGNVPGTSKPTLLKPGAELLRLWAGLSFAFDVQFTGDRGSISYQVKCRAWRDGVGEYECEASCSSMETKYRWRWVSGNQLPPNLDKTVLPQRQQPGKGGSTYTQYRIETENPHDQANTILKMAQKRAFVGVILLATGASRIFTQDIEEIEDVSGSREAADTPTPPPDKHWCSKHQTEFFKKGKMRGYAHKIGDTGEWCNEEEAKSVPPEEVEAEEAPPVPVLSRVTAAADVLWHGHPEEVGKVIAQLFPDKRLYKDLDDAQKLRLAEHLEALITKMGQKPAEPGK